MEKGINYLGLQILVTGAAGFLPSHLCDALLKQGAFVTGVDNFITGHEENLSLASLSSNFQFIRADVTTNPETYLEGKKFDVVFHMASPASPPKYQAHPVETYLVNSVGTHLLLQHLLKTNNKGKFIFSSTSEIYGNPTENPQKESYWGNVNPNGIRSCYDESKRMGETVCGVHARDFGMDVRIARIFNTYGPRMDPEDGRVIPNFLKQVKNHEALTIYGNGTQTRSFCYVDDLIQGLLLLGSLDAAKGETINLGNPDEFTMLELATIIQKVMGTTSELVYKPLPGNDPLQRKPDISKAKKLLGWEPMIKLEVGLRKDIKENKW